MEIVLPKFRAVIFKRNSLANKRCMKMHSYISHVYAWEVTPAMHLQCNHHHTKSDSVAANPSAWRTGGTRAKVEYLISIWPIV